MKHSTDKEKAVVKGRDRRGTGFVGQLQVTKTLYSILFFNKDVPSVSYSIFHKIFSLSQLFENIGYFIFFWTVEIDVFRTIVFTSSINALFIENCFNPCHGIHTQVKLARVERDSESLKRQDV